MTLEKLPVEKTPETTREKGTFLFIDAQAGMSGNMFLGAALELLQEQGRDDVIAQWEAAIRALNLPDVNIVQERLMKCGTAALHVDVQHQEHHPHRGLSDVLGVLHDAALPEKVLVKAEKIFRALAVAEARVHQMSVEDVHFHEVGAVDAIVDIMSAAFLSEALHVDKVVCSPIRTGFGFVKCAHGDMPVPAPATARLLLGKPSFAGEVAGEWLTPTGAAILDVLVDEYGPQPLMRTLALGVGAGTKGAPHPNAVRLFIGEVSAEQDPVLSSVLPSALPGTAVQTLLELETHVDDMNGEDLGALSQVLLKGPALDVTMLCGVGKKSRPQHIVKVLLHPEDQQETLALLFQHSTTFGVRISPVTRVHLLREEHLVSTAFGEVRVKANVVNEPAEAMTASILERIHPEYDDCAQLAVREGVSVAEVRQAAISAFRLSRDGDAK
ncbi:MAG: nickel pincer cofactor biosynthesis protein LarC [Deltaproteobacteria bacterium]|nr:nickel pincer cofactor biosynthesis protein LarC [Deltaproteobacteria bacterium]